MRSVGLVRSAFEMMLERAVYRQVRADISAVKALMPRVITEVASRALQVHGSLGVSEEMPFIAMIAEGHHMGLADGPTEVHKLTLARELLKPVRPARGLFPSAHLLRRRQAAEAKFAALLG